MCAAHHARPSAVASKNMCPASAMSTKALVQMPTPNSTTINVEMSRNAFFNAFLSPP